MPRQMSLGLFMLNTGHHAASWLDPSTSSDPKTPFRNVLALASGVQDFVDLVVPELQRRELMRTAYAGSTLRSHLGLELDESKPKGAHTASCTANCSSGRRLETMP